MELTGDDHLDAADVVVIGGGPVGENAAQYATEGTDLTAVIVEAELLGGECSYYACIPSKALLRPVEVAATAAHLPGLSGPRILRDALLSRRDEWVSQYDDSGQVSWAEGAGIGVVRGRGRLSGERTVEVAGGDGEARTLRARRAVVIATGSEPVLPEMFTAAMPWGSRDATGVVEVPARLAVVGGGVVACEAATWLAALGSRVTLVVRGSRLLTTHEPFASQAVLESLRDSGVTVLLDTSVQACRRVAATATGLGRQHGGEVTLTTSSGTVTADELLVATGRRPRLDDLGLETLGLTPDDVRRGADLPDWLCIVGDASGEALLTHWGKYRARVVGEQIARAATGQPAPPVPDAVPVPQVVFTDPQVASVGLTEDGARHDGLDVVVARVPTASATGAALLRDDVRGDAQLVVDRVSGTLVGATFVGPEMGELLHAATIAIVGRVPVRVLRHAVPSYPTASELWLRLLESLPLALRS